MVKICIWKIRFIFNTTLKCSELPKKAFLTQFLIKYIKVYSNIAEEWTDHESEQSLSLYLRNVSTRTSLPSNIKYIVTIIYDTGSQLIQ